jgi:hypothetical protein
MRGRQCRLQHIIKVTIIIIFIMMIVITIFIIMVIIIMVIIIIKRLSPASAPWTSSPPAAAAEATPSPRVSYRNRLNHHEAPPSETVRIPGSVSRGIE